MKYRTASWLSISLAIGVFVVVPVLLVYAADPFQIYHKSLFAKAGYSTDQEYQHAGWINTLLADPAENYQGIVIGSSTMANYTQALVNEHLPWGNILNLSVNGSTPVMQASIARHALAVNPQIHHILWDIHPFYSFPPDYYGDNSKPDHFPYYLYNDSKLDDFRYFFNISNVQSSIRFLMNDFSKFNSDVVHNGPYYESLLASGVYAAYGSLANKRDKLLPTVFREARLAPDPASFAHYEYPSLEKNLLDILLPYCNTDKDIRIIFSPANRYFYSAMEGTDYLYSQIFMRRYVLSHTRSCKNIKVYAFDDADIVTANLSNYADNYHYVIGVNHYVMQSLGHEKHLLSVDNIREYETVFIDRINHFPEQLAREVRDALPQAAAISNDATGAP